MKKRKIILTILLVLLVSVFGISTFFVIRDVYRSKTENAANRELSSVVNDLKDDTRRHGSRNDGTDETEGETDDGEEQEDPYTEDGILKYLAPIYEQNSDLAGWLTIPGTTIDYPVMYTPEYIQKYLRMAFNGEWALSGSLFLGEGWSEDNNYAIIYGHHMQDGSMFCNLVDYESLEFAKEHPIVEFDTLREMGDYEVMCACLTQVNGDPSAFHYYEYTDLRDPEIFAEFFEGVGTEALYFTDVKAEYGDRILVLSTFNYHTDNGRFYLVAVMKAEPTEGGTE